MEFNLLWAALTGVALAWLGTRIWPDRLPQRAPDLMVGAAAAGLLVGRLTAMAIQGINPLANPADILIVRGGVHTGAASLGALVVLAWALRRDPARLDALAPAALLGLAGWHAGCLWRDACLGIGSGLPWAYAAAGGDVTRHPVELYAAGALLLGALLVSRLPWRLLMRAGVALSLAGVIRLATEPLRLTILGGPVAWYAAGTIVGVLVVVGGGTVLGRRHIRPT